MLQLALRYMGLNGYYPLQNNTNKHLCCKMLKRGWEYNKIGHCFYHMWWLLKEPFDLAVNSVSLLAAGVFGDSLGSFTDCVFGQFTGQKQPDGGLDLAGADG